MNLGITEEPEPKNRRKEDSGIPWWISAIYKVGIPSAIAVFLIYFLVTEVNSDIKFIRDNFVLHAESVNQVNRDIIKQNEKITRVLQQICSNAAKTNIERQGCFQ